MHRSGCLTAVAAARMARTGLPVTDLRSMLIAMMEGPQGGPLDPRMELLREKKRNSRWAASLQDSACVAICTFSVEI